MTEQPVEEMSAPDGSFLMTRQTVKDATVTMHTQFKTLWPLVCADHQELIASCCIVRAMGFPPDMAPEETLRLRKNPYFIIASRALAETYEQFRKDGML